MNAGGATGQDVMSTFAPTFQAFGDMLRHTENSSRVPTAKRETLSYGSRKRQKLNLYTPSNLVHRFSSVDPRPIIIFSYGRTKPQARIHTAIPEHIAYKNIGRFFAEELGFQTIVMDDKLLGHDAEPTKGGEEIGRAMSWVESQFGTCQGQSPRDLFLLGNSTSAAHISTWLSDERFSWMRQSLIRGNGGVRVAGIVLQDLMLPPDPFSMNSMLQVYFGGETEGTETSQRMQTGRAFIGLDVRAKQPWPNIWMRKH